MKKSIFSLMLLLPGLLFAGPKSPDWLNNLKSVYPEKTYLSSLGYGSSESEAKTNALSELTIYISAEVNTDLSTVITDSSVNGKSKQETVMVDEVSIKSKINLFGLDFTEPFYIKSKKKYACAAFINKQNAFNQYKEKLDTQKAEYYEILNTALEENDPFTKFKFLGLAQKKGNELLEDISLVNLICPNKNYEEEKLSVAKIYSLRMKEIEKCSVKLSVSNDFDDCIKNALTEVFTAVGFKVSSSGNYSAVVTVKDNLVTDGEIFAVYPGIEIEITNTKGRSIYSFASRLTERFAAYSLENARRKGVPDLADKLKIGLARDFKDSL